MEKHFQDMAQKVQDDRNLDTFVAYFAQHFDQKTTPQNCREIMRFENILMVNPIGPMENWIKS